jgi:hypothetical protein
MTGRSLKVLLYVSVLNLLTDEEAVISCMQSVGFGDAKISTILSFVRLDAQEGAVAVIRLAGKVGCRTIS